MCSASTVLITLAFNIKKSEISWDPKLHIPSQYNHIKILVLCRQVFMSRGYKLLLFVFCSVFVEAYLPTENLHVTTVSC